MYASARSRLRSRSLWAFTLSCDPALSDRERFVLRATDVGRISLLEFLPQPCQRGGFDLTHTLAREPESVADPVAEGDAASTDTAEPAAEPAADQPAVEAAEESTPEPPAEPAAEAPLPPAPARPSAVDAGSDKQ